jgi:hypothetical protein
MLGENYNYLRERIGKITNALYKVTDFLPDQEPLKWKLRETGLSIFANISSFEKEASASKIAVLNEIISYLDLMIHALDLAAGSGFISGLNFEILKREYEKIKDIIEPTTKEEEIVFSEDMLALSRQLTDSIDKPVFNKQNKGQLPEIGSNGHLAQQMSNKMSNKTFSKKDNRTEKILSFIKQNGCVGVKDLALHFPDISQKSIQRSLVSLANAGILKKEGDKRWRKYSLI